MSRTAWLSKSPDRPSMAPPPASSVPRWRAIPREPTTRIDCCIRCAALARRGKGASRESVGRKPSRRSPRASRRSPPTIRSKSCPTATPEPWDWCRASRCRSASFIGWALVFWIARSAHRPALPATRSPWVLESESTWSWPIGPSSSSSGAATRSPRACISGRVHSRPSAAVRRSSRSIRTARSPRRNATRTSRCCREPTPRSRSVSCTCSSATTSSITTM